MESRGRQAGEGRWVRRAGKEKKRRSQSGRRKAGRRWKWGAGSVS